MFICKIWLFEFFFHNTTNLICRSTDISKCFRGSLRLRDNESRLYTDTRNNEVSFHCFIYKILKVSNYGDSASVWYCNFRNTELTKKETQVQSNFNGSNTFGTMKISSRQG